VILIYKLIEEKIYFRHVFQKDNDALFKFSLDTFLKFCFHSFKYVIV